MGLLPLIALIVSFTSPSFALVEASYKGTGAPTVYSGKGIGACGTEIDSQKDVFVATSPAHWKGSHPGSDPICVQCVSITVGNTTIVIPVQDKCQTCDPGNLDLAPLAYAHSAALDTVCQAHVSWSFVPCLSANATTQAPK